MKLKLRKVFSGLVVLSMVLSIGFNYQDKAFASETYDFGGGVTGELKNGTLVVSKTGGGTRVTSDFREEESPIYNVPGIVDVLIESGVEYLGTHSFRKSSCSKITGKVIIGNDVKGIANSAFANNAIRELKIGTSVKRIASNAFRENLISQLTIPDCVEVISEYAFHRNKIEQLSLGARIKQIGDYAFSKNSIETLIIPDSVEKISEYAFHNNKITQLTLGNNVTQIGNQAFHSSELSTVTIPDKVRNIGNSAFYSSLLTEINIPSNVEVGVLFCKNGNFQSDYHLQNKQAGLYKWNSEIGNWKLDIPKNDESRLSSLSVNGEILEGFDPDIKTYTLAKTSNGNITISAIAVDINATITGHVGEQLLREGSNVFTIKVTGEDGSNEIYTINITKEIDKNQDPPEVIIPPEDTDENEDDKETEEPVIVNPEPEPEENPEIEAQPESPNTSPGSSSSGSYSSARSSDSMKIKKEEIEYFLPEEEVSIERIAEILGVKAEEIESVKSEVKINQLDKAIIKEIEKNAKKKNYNIVSPPVEFKVVVKIKFKTGESKQLEISKFSNYVQRILKTAEDINIKDITTGVVYNEDGTFVHIPTEVFQKNNINFTNLKSPTNSIYLVIGNSIKVESVENHWAENAVNCLASKIIIAEPETFSPDKNITRGEFAEYITKAIGIYRSNTVRRSIFLDVKQTDIRADAINAAAEYGIIKGFMDKTFRPNEEITREQAMTMYAKAIDITGLKVSDRNKIERYKDKEEVPGWAYEAVNKTLNSGVFHGRAKDIIYPKETLTYAEAAIAIQTLLIESNLINR